MKLFPFKRNFSPNCSIYICRHTVTYLQRYTADYDLINRVQFEEIASNANQKVVLIFSGYRFENAECTNGAYSICEYVHC